MQNRGSAAIFIIGLLLLVLGFTLYLNDPKRDIQPESEVLYSGQVRVPAHDWRNINETIDGVTLFVSNISMSAHLSSLNGSIVFHVMNISQFAEWKANPNSIDSHTTQVLTDSYDYTTKPERNDIYCFVFENREERNSTDFYFSIAIAGDFLRFDYSLTYLYLVIGVIGGLVCLAGAQWFSRAMAKPLDNWAKPFWRVGYDNKAQDEMTEANIANARQLRRFLKYVMLAFVIGVIVIYTPFVLEMSGILDIRYLRPEYKTLAIDYFIRTFFFRFFNVFPLILGMVLMITIAISKIADFSGWISMKFHLQGPKQTQIGKELTSVILETVYSKKFVALILPIFSAFIFLKLFSPEDLNLYMILLITAASTLGIYFGLRLSIGFSHIREKLDIKEFASHRFFVGTLITFPIISIPMLLIVYSLMLINVSGFWQDFSKFIFFRSVELFYPFSLVSNYLPSFDKLVVGVTVAFFAFAILFIALMTVVPLLYVRKRSEIVIVMLVFVLVEITQEVSRILLMGTLRSVFEPSALIAPFVASAIGIVAERHYKKRLRKALIRKKTSSALACP
jgi:hypothetical protein